MALSWHLSLLKVMDEVLPPAKNFLAFYCAVKLPTEVFTFIAIRPYLNVGLGLSQ
jgi:hypothetical protein